MITNRVVGDSPIRLRHARRMRILTLAFLASGLASAASAQPLEPLRARLQARVDAWQSCPRPPVVTGTPSKGHLRALVDGAALCRSTVKRTPDQTPEQVEARKAAFAKACTAIPTEIAALAARPDPCATRPSRWKSRGDGAAILNFFRAVALHVTTAPPAEVVPIALAGMQASQDFARHGPLVDHMIAVAGYDLVHTALTTRISALPKPALKTLATGLDALLALEPAYGEMLAGEADYIAAFALAPNILGPKWLPADARHQLRRAETGEQLGMLRLWARLDAYSTHIAKECGPAVSAGSCELALHDAARRFGSAEANDPLTGAGNRFAKYTRKLATRRAALAGLRAQVKIALGGACPPAAGDLVVPGVDGPLRLEPGGNGLFIEVPATLGDIRGPIAELACTPKEN